MGADDKGWHSLPRSFDDVKATLERCDIEVFISNDKPKNAPEFNRIECLTSLLIPAARDFLHQSKQKKAAPWKFVTGCACLHMREQNVNLSEVCQN